MCGYCHCGYREPGIRDCRAAKTFKNGTRAIEELKETRTCFVYRRPVLEPIIVSPEHRAGSSP